MNIKNELELHVRYGKEAEAEFMHRVSAQGMSNAVAWCEEELVQTIVADNCSRMLGAKGDLRDALANVSSSIRKQLLGREAQMNSTSSFHRAQAHAIREASIRTLSIFESILERSA